MSSTSSKSDTEKKKKDEKEEESKPMTKAQRIRRLKQKLDRFQRWFESTLQSFEPLFQKIDDVYPNVVKKSEVEEMVKEALNREINFCMRRNFLEQSSHYHQLAIKDKVLCVSPKFKAKSYDDLIVSAHYGTPGKDMTDVKQTLISCYIDNGVLNIPRGNGTLDRAFGVISKPGVVNTLELKYIMWEKGTQKYSSVKSYNFKDNSVTKPTFQLRPDRKYKYYAAKIVGIDSSGKETKLKVNFLTGSFKNAGLFTTDDILYAPERPDDWGSKTSKESYDIEALPEGAVKVKLPKDLKDFTKVTPAINTGGP
eukprot:g632.t1